MSRKRKQKRDNTIMFTPKGYKVYGRRDGKGPPYRAAMEAALQQTGLMGVAFEAIILHAPQCPAVNGGCYCNCRCTFGELRAIGESIDPSFNMAQIVHVARNRN
jgi:hypothetical protein